jgi:3-oxoacyl-[acyl-carrier-protein] synthase III
MAAVLNAGRPVTITGLGVDIPERVVTNDELATFLDTSDEWIRQRTGISERRVADPGLGASDLGAEAARRAIDDAGLSPLDVGLVVAASISPDHLFPATAARIAHQVGARDAGACDLLAGCTGFVYALSYACGLVASGLQDHVLVVGAEAISRILDWQDRSTAVLFGDAAGAAVVSVAQGPERILGFDLGNDGAGADLLRLPAGGSRLPASATTVAQRDHFLKMNGREVYRFATRIVTTSATRVLSSCGRTVAEIDLFVPHQANLRIIDAACRHLGIDRQRVYTNLERYGNTSCASIPLCLEEARSEGRLREGDLVLLMGFGAGLSWGACLMEWGR